MNNSKNKILPHLLAEKDRWQVTKYATHLIVLAIFFVLPELLMSWGHRMPEIVYFHTLVCVAVFYLNYFIFIDKFLFKRKWIWAFFLANIALIALYILMLYVFQDQLIPMHSHKPGMHMHPHDAFKWKRFIGGFMMRDAILQTLAVCLSIALRMSEKWVKWSIVEKQMLAERRENELKNLKNQLNPHFLFNTLNNIYALIDISGQKAQLAIHELSQLLRYVLYENNDRVVPLERDMLFVKNYIELMRLRLNSLVTLTVKINEADGVGKTIAPLMFISLVENAFKHGVSASKHTEISIAISVSGDSVHCHVENSYFPKDSNDKSGSGVGIANLKRQLSLLYPERHTYKAECIDDKYIADLVIDLKEVVTDKI